jgi:hypothetical protein
MEMKVIWELDTDNPLDQQVLSNLPKINFLPTETTKPNSVGQESITEKPEEIITPDKKQTPKKKRASKKQKLKEKSKEALLKLDLEKMIDYIEARGEVNLVECRILAKHYNDEYDGFNPLIEILHELGANNFEDLPDTKCKKFASAVIKLVKDEQPKGEPEETDDDPFGI